MKTVLLSLVLLGAASSAGHPDVAPRWTVQGEVQMVALPPATALALIPKLRAAGAFAAADARLQELLASGEAELLGWPSAEGFVDASGRPEETLPVVAVSESGEEVRFPSEFQPPQVPGGNQTLRPGIKFLSYLPPQTIHAPTASDTRMAGPRLELKGRIDDRNLLSLQVNVSLVWLAAMEPAIGARADRVESPSIEQPRFRSLKTEAKLRVMRAADQLLGVFAEQAPQPRIILFLLHVRVAPAPSPL